MASKSLSVAIALDGAKEIEKQLADIGAAGQKAFKDIEKAAREAGGFDQIKPEQVTAKLKELGVVGKEAFDKITTAVESATKTERLVGAVGNVEKGVKVLNGSLLGLIRVFGPLGLAIGAAEIALGKLKDVAVDAVAAINGIEAAAAKAGTSVEKFDKLSQSLQKAGVSAKNAVEGIQKISEAMDKSKVDAVAGAFERLQKSGQLWNQIAGGIRFPTSDLRTLQDAAAGVGPAADKAREALKQLGQPVPVGNIFAPPIPTTLDAIASKTNDASAVMARFIATLEAIKDPAERNATAYRLMGDAGLAVAKSLNTGATSSAKFADQMAQDANTITQAQANTAASFEQDMNRMKSAWDRLMTRGDMTALADMFAAFHNQMMQSTNQTTASLGNLIARIGELASSIGGNVWSAFASAGKAAIETVGSAVDRLIEKLAKAAQYVGSLFSGAAPGRAGSTEPAPGMAGGGFVRGPGSGTSDSILARLSRGEFVINARAVQHWGPALFAALNALQRPPSFALGGPVAMPAFAGGGLGGGANLGTLTLGLPSGGSVTVRATQGVVDQLRREAAMAQVRSGGRKPSRYT